MSNRKLYLFNPDSDLALANGDANYMPPASARQMATDLALLPVWYADPGSVVLGASAYNLAFLREMQQRLTLPVEWMTEPEVASAGASTLSPWGWNPAIRKRMSLLEVAAESLPSLETLELFRTLSHRGRAVELLPKLQLSDCFCGESLLLTTPSEWQRFVEERETCLLKAPLSGSGKGLNWCRGTYTSFVSGWCSRVDALQGGVVGEPIYNKVEDFAMEFLSDGVGQVVFAGYSLFATGSGGAYEGNLLLADEAIERRLSQYVPLGALQALRFRLEAELSLLVGTSYIGYLGVDMMICRFEGAEPEYRIHPCVEINLRMNMGVVARLLYDRYVQPGSQGVFRVEFCSSAGEALSAHRQMEESHSLQIDGGRLVSGYLSLVPVTAQSRYRAFVLL